MKPLTLEEARELHFYYHHHPFSFYEDAVTEHDRVTILGAFGNVFFAEVVRLNFSLRCLEGRTVDFL